MGMCLAAGVPWQRQMRQVPQAGCCRRRLLSKARGVMLPDLQPETLSFHGALAGGP